MMTLTKRWGITYQPLFLGVPNKISREDISLKKNEKLTDHIEHIVQDAKPECACFEVSGQSPVQSDEGRDDDHREVEPSDLFVPVRPGDGRQRLGLSKEFVHIFV
jgi:hypothetical protein